MPERLQAIIPKLHITPGGPVAQMKLLGLSVDQLCCKQLLHLVGITANISSCKLMSKFAHQKVNIWVLLQSSLFV